MSNPDHVKFFNKTHEEWNQWRKDNPLVKPDLSFETFERKDLNLFNLSNCNFESATFNHIDLCVEMNQTTIFKKTTFNSTEFHPINYLIFDNCTFNPHCSFPQGVIHTNFIKCIFEKNHMKHTTFKFCDFMNSTFKSDLHWTGFINCNLSNVIFSNIRLDAVNFSGSNLSNSDFSSTTAYDCRMYGISAWDIIIDKKTTFVEQLIQQKGYMRVNTKTLEILPYLYIIAKEGKDPTITNYFTDMSSNMVLILGRFNTENKIKLDKLKKAIDGRRIDPSQGFLMAKQFDFIKPENKDFTNMVILLSRMSKFIIADLSDPTSVPYELANIVPIIQLPIIPIFDISKPESSKDENRIFSMFIDLMKYPWVAEPQKYKTIEEITDNLPNTIYKKYNEIQTLINKKNEEIEKLKI